MGFIAKSGATVSITDEPVEEDTSNAIVKTLSYCLFIVSMVVFLA